MPLGPKPAVRAARLVEQWKSDGILQQDRIPAIFPYYQYFKLPGQQREFCRKGFICLIRAYDWADNVLLRHENTIPEAVNDRIELLERSQLQTSPTHGLYTDAGFSLEPYMDEAIKSPLYESEDYQGVRDVLAVIQDAEVIRKFTQLLADRQVLLADGHHRYEGSLRYRQQMTAHNPQHTGREPYNFHLMYLTNTEADDLRILPTHRLLRDISMPKQEFLERLEEYFIIMPKEDPYELNEVIVGKKWAFGLYIDGEAYKIRLKPEAHALIDWPVPTAVKDLDLTVMHYFVLQKVLGMSQEEQRKNPRISYVKNFGECIAKVSSGEATMALITNEVSMDQVKQVCYSGAIMPQKSTFFYPKVICGFLFSSVNEDEASPLFDSLFQFSEAAGAPAPAGSAG